MDPFANGMCGSRVGALAEQAREEMEPATSKHDRSMESSAVEIQAPRRSVAVVLLGVWRGWRQRGQEAVSPLR